MRRHPGAALVCLLIAALAFSAADPWQPVRFLSGRWQGTVQGERGDRAVTRSYAMSGVYLEERSLFPAPRQEERGFISVDRVRQKIVLRRFGTDGVVITGALNAAESTANLLVFDSESIENLDGGSRARVTWEVFSSDEFVETVELAAPGKTLGVVTRTRFTRVGRATGE